MWQKLVVIAIFLAFLGAVAQRVWHYSAAAPGQQGHVPGDPAGVRVAFGNDRYHVEAIFTSDGLLKLYLLGSDGSRVMEVERRTLTAYLTQKGNPESHAVMLHPAPQAGDRAGNTSCFCGTLPVELVGRSLQVNVPNLCIGEERFHLTFMRHSARVAEMPAPVAATEERQLHLVPGGKYTVDDIAANGHLVPSLKYRGFQARHDHDPQPGDQVCPVSRTKADPACSWIVGGQEYLFCCPPCIDEFVRLAKEQPQNAKPPAAYVQQ